MLIGRRVIQESVNGFQLRFVPATVLPHAGYQVGKSAVQIVLVAESSGQVGIPIQKALVTKSRLRPGRGAGKKVPHVVGVRAAARSLIGRNAGIELRSVGTERRRDDAYM